MRAFDEADGGTDSRKYKLTKKAVLLVMACWCLTALIPALEPSFTTMAGTVVALLGLYLTGNIANKLVVGKNVNQAAQIEKPVEPEQPEEE